jgi:hypothetical protein
MPKGAIYLSRYSNQIGSVGFELTSIYGSGGPDFPLLTVRADIGLSPYIDHSQGQSTRYIVTLIRAAGQFCSPEQRVVARFGEDIAHIASDPSFVSTNQVSFEIPLDHVVLARIEKDRTGGDLRVQLKFNLLFALHAANGQFREFVSGRVDGLTFVIPRSEWVDRILPALGYGGLELLEVRYGMSTVARSLPKAVAEINEAKKYLLEGDWEKAVGHCRKSLEVVLDSRPSSLPTTAKFRDKVNAFICDNLTTLGEQQAKLLARQMELIWEVSSQAAHASPATFVRADAEFLLRTTMALVEYFGRLLN